MINGALICDVEVVEVVEVVVNGLKRPRHAHAFGYVVLVDKYHKRRAEKIERCIIEQSVESDIYIYYIYIHLQYIYILLIELNKKIPPSHYRQKNIKQKSHSRGTIVDFGRNS